MKRPVVISEPALLDLLDINDYYLVEVDDKTAAKIIDHLEAAVNSLACFTERDIIPKELLTLGIRQYRQVIVKPYRSYLRAVTGNHHCSRHSGRATGYGNLVDTTPCQVWTVITLNIEVNAFTDYLLGYR